MAFQLRISSLPKYAIYFGYGKKKFTSLKWKRNETSEEKKRSTWEERIILYRKEWFYRLTKTWLQPNPLLLAWSQFRQRYFKMVSLECINTNIRCVYALGQWLFPLDEHTNIKCDSFIFVYFFFSFFPLRVYCIFA